MTIKLFEVRDRGTTLACIGISIHPAEAASERDWLLMRRAGYGERCILFGRLEGGAFHYDPHEHPGRTVPTAHLYVAQNWDTLSSGDIVDVEFILGETPAPKTTDLS